MSASDGLSRPMRVAGLLLIGVAVVAAVLGTITLLDGDGGGGDQNNASPTPTASGTEQPGGPPPGQSQPPNSPAPPPPGGQPPQVPTTPPPPPPGAPPAPGQPGGPVDQQAAASHKWVTVRLYNNSTVHGLAANAANDLRGQGWNVVETSNYSAGVIPTTTAYFRPGTDEEAAAHSLAAAFGMRVEPRFPGIADASPGVIVILTNDYTGVPKGKDGG